MSTSKSSTLVVSEIEVGCKYNILLKLDERMVIQPFIFDLTKKYCPNVQLEIPEDEEVSFDFPKEWELLSRCFKALCGLQQSIPQRDSEDKIIKKYWGFPRAYRSEEMCFTEAGQKLLDRFIENDDCYSDDEYGNRGPGSTSRHCKKLLKEICSEMSSINIPLGNSDYYITLNPNLSSEDKDHVILLRQSQEGAEAPTFDVQTFGATKHCIGDVELGIYTNQKLCLKYEKHVELVSTLRKAFKTSTPVLCIELCDKIFVKKLSSALKTVIVQALQNKKQEKYNFIPARFLLHLVNPLKASPLNVC